MAKITYPENCENSSKALFIRDMNIAFAENNIDKALEFFTEDVNWRMVGDAEVIGLENVKKIMKEMDGPDIKELNIENIITHGNKASANGFMKMSDGKIYEFCDVYIFNSHSKDAKIKKLTSFVIEKHDQ